MRPLLLLAVFAVACDAEIYSPNPAVEPLPADVPAKAFDPAGDGTVAFSGLRRLTQDEYDNTLRDLLGDVTRPGTLVLPDDGYSPFDNDYRSQAASQALVDGADLLAADAIARLFADPARRDRIVGCKPHGARDQACFAKFVDGFGRRALRRPVDDKLRDRYLGLIRFSAATSDFYAGVETVMRAMLQHPRFLYRVELGSQDPARPDVLVLDDFEVAARLSYLLWGTMPDDALLDRAAKHGLSTPEQVRAAAQSMLKDPRALDRIDRFHAEWLGYDRYMPESPALARKMRAETKATLERVIFSEQRPWQDVLRLDSTFVDGELAAHYALPGDPPAQAGWVSYGATGRRGILSHATFLSIGAKFDDTSPTKRGQFIRERLFCQDIPPPPPNVDPDNPPGVDPNACKSVRYKEQHSVGSCAGCHKLMDPIGFGLERFDALGRFRTTEPNRPDCPIDGNGELAGVGTFNGPAELSALLVASPQLNRCFATQLYRFASGHAKLDDADQHVLQPLVDRIGEHGDFAFTDVLLAYVSNPAFGQRRNEE